MPRLEGRIAASRSAEDFDVAMMDNLVLEGAPASVLVTDRAEWDGRRCRLPRPPAPGYIVRQPPDEGRTVILHGHVLKGCPYRIPQLCV